MNDLVIPLASVGDDGYAIDSVLTSAQIRSGIAPSVDPGPVHVSGTLSAIDSEYLFRGEISGDYAHPCDRCLMPSTTPYRIEVVWFFERGHSDADTLGGSDVYEMDETADDEDRVRTFVGETIDLTEHVREELILTAPSKFLCAPDCKGLCPCCGANLNTARCNCPAPAKTSNSGLAALAELFPDLKSSED